MTLRDLRIAAASLLPHSYHQVSTTPAPTNVGQSWQEGAAMSVNEELVASGLRVLRDPLSVFVCQGIENHFGETWWTEGVLESLVSPQTPTIEDVRRYRHLPENGSVEECAALLDIAVCLILLTKQWFRVFAPLLGQDRKDDRGWAYELMGVRKKNKHLAAGDHASDFTWRALDTMYRLIESIDVDAATEIVTLRSSVDLSAYGPTPVAAGPSAEAMLDEETARETDTTERAVGTQTDRDLDEAMANGGPDFSDADLRRMNFAGAILEGADFTNANLVDSDFKGASLKGANFKGAKLGNANLTEADLSNAVFENTTLSITRPANPNYPSLDPHTRGANLTGAKLDGATLNFTGADLRRTNFTGTNLEGADFTDANLSGASLRGALLRGVNLKGANIRDADTAEVQWR